jgi:hypothetical protein
LTPLIDAEFPDHADKLAQAALDPVTIKALGLQVP